MTRPWAMTMLATLLAGCQSPTAAIDPFFGRQAVTPPNSMLASSAPANNNYYQPPPTTVGASLPPAPATASTGPGGAFAPPGNNFGFSGANPSATNRLGSRPATSPASAPTSNGTGSSYVPRGSINNPPMYQTNPSERPPSAAGAGTSNSSNSTPFQAGTQPPASGFRPATLASRPADSTTSNVGNAFNNRSALPNSTASGNNAASTSNGFYTPPRLRTQGAASPPTDIMNLPDRNAPLRPPVGTGSGSFNTPSSNNRGLGGAGASNYDANGDQPGGFQPPSNIRRASFTEPAASSGTKRSSRVGTLSGVGARGDYGKDANYGWLRGKLEYSKTEDRWKLRYIPIDGETDDYGGSVTLLGSRELQGFEAGDYVTAYGTLGETSAGGGRDFSPAYRLDRVVRQSE